MDSVCGRAIDGSMEPRRDGPADRSFRRDARVDLLRGLALASILFDHIPGNSLSNLTIQGFGLCDAAEIFVFLAGYSAMIAYGRAFDRHGAPTFFRKIGWRCVTLYATHIALFLATLFIVRLHAALTGAHVSLLAPILNDGWAGILRGLALTALPIYLDILPLYIVLLVFFPLVFFCIRHGTIRTLVLSTTVYLIANELHLNLPNYVNPSSVELWTLNPFTWQLIYVCGAAFAWQVQKKNDLFTRPRTLIRQFCLIYIIFALFCARWGDLWWSSMMVDDHALAFFGNEPKSFGAPWRVLDALALAYLTLTSWRLQRVAEWRILRPVLASGRHALPIFAAICLLALLGRVVFKDVGNGLLAQVCVNAVSVALLFWLALELDRKGPRLLRPASAPARPSLERAA